jgi:phospholipid/cholesterol/gamma-HCH transport system substrate-binding protein
MAKFSANLTRVVTAAIVLAVLVGVGVYALLGSGGTKKVTANFASAVGVYPGTPVKILGVPVGEVSKVTPQGDSVAIELTYDSKYKVPANAVSLIVANSLVSDRYIQLAPAYSGSGATLSDGAKIPLARTASPAELDDIYGALDKLSVALGPNGTNKTGSLSTFLKVASANLNGNGAALGNSITQLSKAATTLSNGREDLFGTVKNLQAFTKALSDSDAQVRHFEEQLAQVAGDLANERSDLGSALHNLTSALTSVATFVKDNASKVHTDLDGLKDLTNVLVKEKASLNETLAIAPVALSNIVHAYQDDLGVTPTRSNAASLADPAQFCDLISGVFDQLINSSTYKDTPLGTLLGPLLGTLLSPDGPLKSLSDLLGSAAGTVVSTCLTATGGKASKSTTANLPSDPKQLAALLESLLTGGLGGLVGAGG